LYLVGSPIDPVKHHLFEPNIVCEYLYATCITVGPGRKLILTISLKDVGEEIFYDTDF